MGILKRGNVWWVDVTIGGKRHRFSAETDDRTEALIAEAQYKKRHMNGEIPKATDKVSPNLTIEDGFEKIYEDQFQYTKAADSYRSHMRILVDVFNGLKPPVTKIVDVNEKAIYQAIQELKKRGNSDASINRKLSTLTRLLETACYNWKLIPVVVPIERKKEDKSKRLYIIDYKTEANLLKTAGEIDIEAQILFTMLLDTGMRLSEGLDLKWRDVDFGKNEIHVWEPEKHGNERTLPMTKRLHTILENCKTMKLSMSGKLPEKIFTISFNRVQYVWGQIRTKLGIDAPEFIIHSMRHTFASRLVQSGVELAVVQHLLGHKSITSTERYAHLNSKQYKPAIEALEAHRFGDGEKQGESS